MSIDFESHVNGVFSRLNHLDVADPICAYCISLETGGYLCTADKYCQGMPSRRPYLMDLAKFAAWLVAIALIVLACGAVANASPVHHDRSRHVSQSLRHQHEVRHAALRRDDAPEAASSAGLFARWRAGGSGGSLVAEARSQLGKGAIYGRASLWCARFVNWVLAHTGRSGTGSDAARSFAGYGRRVSGPQPGAIAVMTRKGGGHVGIVSGVDASGNPIVISGNSGGRVRERPYSRSRVYAYVVPN